MRKRSCPTLEEMQATQKRLDSEETTHTKENISGFVVAADVVILLLI